jgi:hypothetical protein
MLRPYKGDGMKALRSIFGLVMLVVVALPASSLGQSCPLPLDGPACAFEQKVTVSPVRRSGK